MSDFTSTFHSPALEKEMATHSSVLAWRIPGMAEPGGLPSRGLHRVGQDWSNLAAAAATAWARWMASSTHWTWVWASHGRQWRTGVLQSMGSQKLDTTEWLNDMGRTHKHCEVQFCSLKNRQNQTNKTSYRIHCVALRIKWYTVE